MGILDQPPEEFTYEDYRPQLNANLLRLATTGAIMGAKAYAKGSFDTENKQFASESAAARKANGLQGYKGPGKEVGIDGSKPSLSDRFKSLKTSAKVQKQEAALKGVTKKSLSDKVKDKVKALKTSAKVQKQESALKSMEKINTKTKGALGRQIRETINKGIDVGEAGLEKVQKLGRKVYKQGKEALGLGGGSYFQTQLQNKARGEQIFNKAKALSAAREVPDLKAQAAKTNAAIKSAKTRMNTRALGPVSKITKSKSLGNLSALPKIGGGFGSMGSLV